MLMSLAGVKSFHSHSSRHLKLADLNADGSAVIFHLCIRGSILSYFPNLQFGQIMHVGNFVVPL